MIVVAQTGQSKWMKRRNFALRVGDLFDRVSEPMIWLVAVAAFVVIAYLITAPPIVLAHAKHTGSGSFPAVYGPILMLIESDFGGPIVWYFNSVWGAGLVLIGGDEGIPWYIIAFYILFGGTLFSSIAFPFWKAWGRKRAM